METTTHPHTEAFSAFVEALADSGCELGTILAHMHASQAAGVSAEDALPPEVVLHRLLEDTLRPAFEGFDEAGLEAATRALKLASDTVCAEIYLVPLPGQEGRRKRRRRR